MQVNPFKASSTVSKTSLWIIRIEVIAACACAHPDSPPAESVPPLRTAPAPTKTEPNDSHSPPEPPAPAPETEPLSRDPWRANLDPMDNSMVGPPEVIPDCEERLAAAGVTYRGAKIPVRQAPGRAYVCGAPQIVIYERGPTELRFNGQVVVTCGLAIALARFEHIVQEEAVEHLGQRIKRVTHGGTYACRGMARYKLVSEHSYANAIDLYGFTLADGRVVSVLRDFGPPDDTPPTKEGVFLRSMTRRLYREGIFSNVLTPYFDALHKNHIHVDLARYRVNGTR